MVVPVILAGGLGTKLWPLSRELHPKQFLPLFDGRTPLQDTVGRFPPEMFEPPLVLVHEQQRFLAAQQLRDVGRSTRGVVLEPASRGTAPSVAAAATILADGDPLLLVVPADHRVADVPALHRAVASATDAARSGRIVAFGVVPRYAEPGFGYVRPAPSEQPVKAIESFVEKPPIEVAEAYVREGWLWNSGIYLARASVWRAEIERRAPELLDACARAVAAATPDLDFVRLPASEWNALGAASVDVLVMEQAADAVVVGLDAGWSELGSWASLREVGSPDVAGNVTRGDVITLGSNGNLIHASSRLVAAVGIEDLVVVETADAVLVAARDGLDRIPELVAELKRNGRDEALVHRRVARPWGTYECIDRADRFQVKRITVNPGACLSLQLHHKRAEHWIVVRGLARVTRGEEVFELVENQSTYIPLGTKHRLENPGSEVLELIEVQSGTYLGEDDIVRFEDRYGR